MFLLLQYTIVNIFIFIKFLLFLYNIKFIIISIIHLLLTDFFIKVTKVCYYIV